MLQALKCMALKRYANTNEVYIYPTLMQRNTKNNSCIGKDRQCRGTFSHHRRGLFHRYGAVVLKDASLDNEQLLNVVASVARVHAVPGGVGEDTADSPHYRHGSFSSIGSLSLGGHLNNACGAAGRAGRVEAHEALGSGYGGTCG